MGERGRLRAAAAPLKDRPFLEAPYRSTFVERSRHLSGAEIAVMVETTISSAMPPPSPVATRVHPVPHPCLLHPHFAGALALVGKGQDYAIDAVRLVPRWMCLTY